AERVFERFYRSDPSRARRDPNGPASSGSGLGLSIVAALVRAHGGIVSVETAPGEGATFRVILPLAPEALSGEPDDAEPEDAGSEETSA
ncbi:MAG: HAMP domain-containing sensor histidine kinase, partial [Actinomycetes bacterium]